MIVVKKTKSTNQAEANSKPVITSENGVDTIVIDESKYVRRNQKWTENNIVVPETMQKKLNRIMASTMDPLTTSVNKLIENADKFKESGDYSSAAKQYMEALVRSGWSDYSSILPRLSSCYRHQGHPEKSLDLMNEAVSIYGVKILNPAMLTSIAAACCDLKKWKEAKKYADRAHAIMGGNSSVELISVYSRIKAEKD